MRVLPALICSFGASLTHWNGALPPQQRQPPGPPLAIVGARIIDPGGPARQGPMTILISDGRILTVGPADRVSVPAGFKVLDASGRFVIPGLADMHFHVAPDGQGNSARQDLQTALRWGVTTVLSPGIFSGSLGPLQTFARSDPTDLPRLFLALGFVTARNGYASMADPAFTPESEAEARKVVQHIATLGLDAVKITYSDNSYLMTRPFPLMRASIMAATIAEAHRLGLKAIVHAPELEHAKEALRAGADALAHAVVDRPLDGEFLQLLRASGASYIATEGLFESFGGLQGWLDRVETFDTEHRLAPDVVTSLRSAGEVALDPSMDKAPFSASTVATIRDNLRRIALEGTPIVIGTDTPLRGIFPGLSVHMELLLHVEAGLEPAGALRAATVNAAKLMGKSREFGTIESGKVADLVVLDADPLIDIRNTRRIRQVVRAGALIEPWR